MRCFCFVLILFVLLINACQSQPVVQNTAVTQSNPLPAATDPVSLSPTPSSPVPVSPISPSTTPLHPPPFPTPSPASLPAPTALPRTTLLFTGVIVPARCVQAAIDERGDDDYIYDEVRDMITAADLAVGTLNATISDIPPHTGCVPTYVLVGSSGNADALQRAGFDVMSVATNHIKNCGLMDCGNQAFFDTLDNLRRVGIIPVGAGTDHDEAMQPVVVEVNGVHFGIVSLGQIEPMAFAGKDQPGIAVLNPENLRTAIAAARQVADVVIAMPHWGPEDVPWPTYIQRDLARQLVEAGADLVVGNHTHVVQGWQEIDGMPVFYGLGNFVFDQGLRDHQQGAILKVYFDGSRFTGYEFIPTHVDRDGTVHIAGPQESAEILERIRQASQPLGMKEWQPEYLSSFPVSEVVGLSQEEIIHRLFEQWLIYGTSTALTNTARISEYEIHDVTLEDGLQVAAGDVESTAEVTFSVHPIVPLFSDWTAGNGELNADGWVRGKHSIVALKQDGNRIWIKILDDG